MGEGDGLEAGWVGQTIYPEADAFSNLNSNSCSEACGILNISWLSLVRFLVDISLGVSYYRKAALLSLSL